MTQAVHDRLMFAIRSLVGDLKVLSSMSDTMAKIISSIGFVFLFDRVGVNGVIMTKIVASDGAVYDTFGYSTSMDGDYAIIGADNADVGSNGDQGAAYIFMRSSNVWTQQTNLTASDGASNDNFGRAVSISGDYALVGSPYDDVGVNTNQGSAYVFLLSGESWSQQATLTASNGAAFDYFGVSVSVDGDYALIGAYGADIIDNQNQGSAYVFLRSGSDWNQQAQLVASDGAGNDGFGYSVSLSGEYALVGAYGDDIGGNTVQGSAYVFMRSGTAWSPQTKLTASDGGSDDYFGFSVAIDGSYIIVGADEKDLSGNLDQGAAYIFMGSGSTWNQTAILTASDGNSSDVFGYSVSISGDYALIGAYTDDVGANPNQGSAYIFMRSGSEWSEQMKVTASDGQTDGYFGSATALDGEFALIGAPGDDIDQGAAYTFCLDGQTWTDCEADDDNTADDDGSMMIGGVSILGLSLISLLMMW